MKKRLMIMMTIVAMGAVILAGCGAPAKEDVPVLGKWYDEKGLSGTIEFKEEGKCELVIMGVTVEGDYTLTQRQAKAQ